MVYDVEVVVEVDEMVGQSRNSVHISFDDDRIVGGQKLGRYEILMVDEVNLGVVLVEPFWFLAACDEMNLTHPWCKLLNASEPVFQESVVAEAGFRNTVLGIVFVARVFCEFILPFRVVHVDPSNHKINIHICLFYLLCILSFGRI